MFLKYFYKLAYKVLKIYWYIFRPKTIGALCLIECNNKYLLVKNTYGEDVWKLPGGGIKKYESPEEGVAREIHEELNITVTHLILLEKLISKAEYKLDTIYIFHAKVNSKEFTFDKKELERAEWFTKEELSENINSFTTRALNKIY